MDPRFHQTHMGNDAFTMNFPPQDMGSMNPLTPDSSTYTHFPFSQSTSTPTTPGLTDAASPALTQPESVSDPRAFTVPPNPGPTLAPSFNEDPAGIFGISFGEECAPPQPDLSFDFNAPMPDGLPDIIDFGSESGWDDIFATYSDGLNLNNKRPRAPSDAIPPQSDGLNSDNKRLRASSDAIAPQSLSTELEEQPPSQPGDDSPNMDAGSPAPSDAISPQSLSTNSEEQPPSQPGDNSPNMDAGSPAPGVDTPGVIPGPPPQNRRGRKQSFSNDPTKQFGCEVCNRRFRRQEHLKRHYRSLHTRDKPYRCDECGKSFSRSDNLSQHQRTHGSGTIALDVVGHFSHQGLHPGMPMDFGSVLFQLGANMPGSADEDRSLQSPINAEPLVSFPSM